VRASAATPHTPYTVGSLQLKQTIAAVAIATPQGAQRPQRQSAAGAAAAARHRRRRRQHSSHVMSYDRAAYAGCFDNAAQEWHGELTPSVGEFPKDLEGTFFANGPGKFAVNGQRFRVRGSAKAEDAIALHQMPNNA
jgi:Retinal pigment epithelial membrane protein